MGSFFFLTAVVHSRGLALYPGPPNLLTDFRKTGNLSYLTRNAKRSGTFKSLLNIELTLQLRGGKTPCNAIQKLNVR